MVFLHPSGFSFFSLLLFYFFIVLFALALSSCLPSTCLFSFTVHLKKKLFLVSFHSVFVFISLFQCVALAGVCTLRLSWPSTKALHCTTAVYLVHVPGTCLHGSCVTTELVSLSDGESARTRGVMDVDWWKERLYCEDIALVT